MIGEAPGIVKFGVIPAAVYVATELLPKLLHAGWMALVITAGVAAGVAGFGYLIRLIRRAAGVADRVLEIIEKQPARLDRIERKLADGETHFGRQDKRLDSMDKSIDSINKAIDTIALANRHRIDDALARQSADDGVVGERRSPVDRRERPV